MGKKSTVVYKVGFYLGRVFIYYPSVAKKVFLSSKTSRKHAPVRKN